MHAFPHHRVCGAGILPFRIGSRGEPHFLLGRERYETGWRGSSKVSAFEGGNKASETAAQNAVREFQEESLGVLLHSLDDAGRLRESLHNGEYAVQVAIRMTERNEVHTTFVHQFEWDGSTIEQTFTNRRNALSGLKVAADTLDRLRVAWPRRYPFLVEGDRLERYGDRLRVVDVQASALCGGGAIVFRYSCAHVDDAARTVTHTTSALPDATCLAFVEWLEARRVVLRELASLPEVVRVGAVRVESHGSEMRVRVNGDWLEKVSVRDYTLGELQETLRNNAVVFRPFFISVLRQTLQQFVQPAAPRSVVQRLPGAPMQPMEADLDEEEGE